MNSLDSRFLRPGDCFGQRFPKPGQVRCFIGPGASFSGASANRAQDLIIEVTPRGAGEAAAKQVNVAVKSDGKGGLKVDTDRVCIEAGDGVLFYTADANAGGFVVSGEGPNFSFDNTRLQNDAVYTHAFGTAGRYEWMDPNGGNVSGVVEVREATIKSHEDRAGWFERMKKPAAFEIKGSRCSPAEVEITVGQTVFWSISDTPGIGITDARLAKR